MTKSESAGPVGYLNGEWISLSELKLPVFDQGIVHGVAVTEMLRTFTGEIYQLDAHLQRLISSAGLCRIPLHQTLEEFREILLKLVMCNRSLVPQWQELGVIISATPGPNPTYTGNSAPQPTLYAHTFELPGELWATATNNGLHLAVSKIQQVPDQCIPVTAKSRSRLSWYLADAEVAERYPGARAVVLDQYGYVRETSTANLFVVRNGVLMTPSAEMVLPGICRQVVLDLAVELGLSAAETPVTIDDLLQAEEIFTTSTPYCLLGVSRLNSTAAGAEFPGPITRQLLAAWNKKLGLDIHGQLRELAEKRGGRG